MPIYQDKNTGLYKYRTYIKMPDGTTKQKEKKGFKTKKEAKEAEIQLIIDNEKEILEIIQIKDIEKTISFITLWEEYNRYNKLNLKPSSYRNIKNRIEKHILPYFRDVSDINNIKAIDINNWKEIITDKGFKYAYNKAIYTAFVSLLNYGEKFYNLKENIVSKVGNFKNHNDVKNINFWTYEEFNSFINKVNEPLYNLLFNTLYYTGMRLGECLALNWNDLQDDYIYITKTVSKELVQGKRLISKPKTKSSIRKIMIDQELQENLLKHKENCEKKINFSDNWFIFGDLTPLSPTTIERKKNKYCEEANIKKIRIHDFRHSHASLLISIGVPIPVVQKRLGHLNSSTTLNIYSHMLPDDEYKAIQSISKIKATSAK